MMKEQTEEARSENLRIERDINTMRLAEIRRLAREYYLHKDLGPIYAQKLASVEVEHQRRQNPLEIKKHKKKLRYIFDDMNTDLKGNNLTN